MLTHREVCALQNEMEQQEAYESAKPNLVRALHDLKSVIHWLHETGDWQSEEVDEVFSKCDEAKDILEALVR